MIEEKRTDFSFLCEESGPRTLKDPGFRVQGSGFRVLGFLVGLRAEKKRIDAGCLDFVRDHGLGFGLPIYTHLCPDLKVTADTHLLS